MPTRIEKIITRARDTLADPNAERYSQERLLRLVSEGQQDIIKQTRLLRESCQIIPLPGIDIYDLPDNVWLTTRASFKGAKIPLVTYDEMDSYLASCNSSNQNYNLNNTHSYDIFNDYTWQDRVGTTPEALVYDRLNIQKVKVYPILSEDISLNTYTFEGGDTSFYGGFELGVVTAITNYSFNSVFGVITEIYDPFFTTVFNQNFGVVTKLSEVDSEITIQYFALAPEITSVSDELIISPLLDTALKHYIVSQAYVDDVDTQFQQLGVAAFGFYERELKIGRSTGSKNNTANPDRQTQYRGAFNG